MIKTSKHLAYSLKVEKEELSEIVLSIDKYYYEKKELKYNNDGNIKKDSNGNVKVRVLRPSLKRLKIIQKRILNNILLDLSLPEYIYGGVKNRDNIKNASFHKGKKYIFTTDLKNFFPSIDHKMVYEMFIKEGFSPTVSRTLTQLTTYKGCLPQGTPTASMVANLVLAHRIGERLNNFAINNNIFFSTFIDDLTFSSPIDFKDKVPEILSIITSSFRISHKKTHYKTKNPIVTGIVVKNNRIEVTEKFKKKLQDSESKNEAQLNGLKQYYNNVRKANNNLH